MRPRRGRPPQRQPTPRTAYSAHGERGADVTLPSCNDVAVLDPRELAVVGRIRAGQEPRGLVVFDPSA